MSAGYVFLIYVIASLIIGFCVAVADARWSDRPDEEPWRLMALMTVGWPIGLVVGIIFLSVWCADWVGEHSGRFSLNHLIRVTARIGKRQ